MLTENHTAFPAPRNTNHDVPNKITNRRNIYQAEETIPKKDSERPAV